MENIENFDDGVTHVAPPGEFKPMEIRDRNGNKDVEITDFSKGMSREERNYYGREFDESR